MAGLKRGKIRKQTQLTEGFQIWYKRGFALGPIKALPGVYPNPEFANKVAHQLARKRYYRPGIYSCYRAGQSPESNNNCLFMLFNWQ